MFFIFTGDYGLGRRVDFGLVRHDGRLHPEFFRLLLGPFWLEVKRVTL